MPSITIPDVTTTPNTDQPGAISTVSAPPAPVTPPTTVKPSAKKVAGTPVKKIARPAKTVATKAVVKSTVKAATKRATPATAKTAAPNVALKTAAKAEPNAAIASADKPSGDKLLKAKKPKLVRDSFTIPKLEYLFLDELKKRSGKLGHSIKKSELIRAGIKALAEMSDAGFLKALHAVPSIKTGRPAKD